MSRITVTVTEDLQIGFDRTCSHISTCATSVRPVAAAAAVGIKAAHSHSQPSKLHDPSLNLVSLEFIHLIHRYSIC